MIDVTQTNLPYLLTQLRKGDDLEFTVVYGDGRSDIKTGKLVEINYSFDSRLPLMFFGDESIPNGCHSSWLTKVKLHNGVSCETYTPRVPLWPQYPTGNIIYKTLFNKYGHRPEWKNTLYDMYKIRDTLSAHGVEICSYRAYPLKRLKRLILQIAPRCKIKRKDHIAFYNDEMEELNNSYLDDLEYDYYNDVDVELSDTIDYIDDCD